MNAIAQRECYKNIVVPVTTMLMCFLLILAIGMAITLGVAFATEPEDSAGKAAQEAADKATKTLVGVFENLADNIYDFAIRTILPAAGVGFLCAGWKFLTGGQRGLGDAFKIMGYSVGAVAIVFMAPTLVRAFGGWFVASAQDMSSVNDLFDEINH